MWQFTTLHRWLSIHAHQTSPNRLLRMASWCCGRRTTLKRANTLVFAIRMPSGARLTDKITCNRQKCFSANALVAAIWRNMGHISVQSNVTRMTATDCSYQRNRTNGMANGSKKFFRNHFNFDAETLWLPDAILVQTSLTNCISRRFWIELHEIWKI